MSRVLMHRRPGALLLLAALIALLAADKGCGPQRAAEQPGGAAGAEVTRVVDGDTIEISLGGRSEDVRYIGIDTPETVKPGTPVQCFGPQASAANHALVEHKQVKLVFDAERRDRYGRLLAYVYLPDGRMVNAILVRRGFARTLTIAPNDSKADLFSRLATAAGRRGLGLWKACPL